MKKIGCRAEIEVNEDQEQTLVFDHSRLILVSSGENKSELTSVLKNITDFDASKIHDIVNNTPSEITLIADSNRIKKTKEELEKTGATVIVG